MTKRGFWLQVDGRWTHVQADHDISDEELELIQKMTKAALTLENHEYPEDVGRDCEMCGKPNVYGNRKMCSSCQQIWDS